MFCWCQFYLFLFFYPPFLLKSSSHRGLILFSLSFGQGSQNSVFSHSCIRPRPVPMWSLMTLWIPAHLFMVYITLSPFFFFLTASIQLLNIAPYCWKCSKFESPFICVHILRLLSLSSCRAVSPCHMWVQPYHPSLFLLYTHPTFLVM